MTLNITLATPTYVIQASDRRMVGWPGGKWVDDKANKGVVLQADDGIVAITFAGLGIYRGKRVDLGLAERMLDEGVPELPIQEGLSIIAQFATDWLGRYLKTRSLAHVFVVAGWQRVRASARPKVWTISNGQVGSLDRVFGIREHNASGQRATVLISGRPKAVTRPDRRRLMASMRKSAEVDTAEQALVHMVREAAAKPESSHTINREVLTIGVAPEGVVRSTFYPSGAAPYNYAPLFVWYEAGRDWMAGDAKALPPYGLRYKIGPAMLLERLRGARGPSEPVAGQGYGAWFMFRMSEAKHKHEPVGAVTLFQPVM